MTSLPYPTFIHHTPVGDGRDALSAVGKCRIYPKTCCADPSEFYSIVAKNTEQARVDVDVEDKEVRDEHKKLRKKFMKEGVAMAKRFLTETLKLDVSVVDVEVYVDPEDIIATDGCLAACFLDAGCHAVVTDGSDTTALDAAKLPRDRLVAHLASALSPDALQAAAAFASTISVQVPDGASVESVTTILQYEAEIQKELDFQIVVQLKTDACGCSNNDELAVMIGAMLKSCKDAHGTLTLVDPTAAQLGLSYAACMRTDREDGLFTTVVCTRSGEALGLVYSSKVGTVAGGSPVELSVNDCLTDSSFHCAGVDRCRITVWPRSVLLKIPARAVEKGRHVWPLSNSSQIGCGL